MSASTPPQLPFVSSILHVTDFSPASEEAFAHALAIALLRQTRLWLLHAGRDDFAADEWQKFPGVRRTLESWGLLEPGSPRSAVYDEFRVRAEKVALKARAPMDAVVDFLAENRPDLLVVATGGSRGLPGWLGSSDAEKLARRSGTMTLFVPEGGRGFVAKSDGRISLRRILIPVDEQPDPRHASQVAARAARVLGDRPVSIHFLHVGDRVPEAPLTDEEALTVRVSARAGDPVGGILAAADEDDADLVVMATEGRQGVMDVLRGTVTEQVLRGLGRPLLAVPAR
jgi:nucleotide-binding universal stress UspA family protein